MPSRPDLRDIATNVKEAFAETDRDTLLEILTFVVKEYVVEGPPPMMIHQAETLSDLKGATFVQLISALQTRFDHAELAMFVVDGEQVSVRVGGVVQPLLAQRQPLTGPAPTAAELPRPAAGVRVVEAPVPPRPVTTPAPSAPPPARGISVRGRPAGETPAAAAPSPAPPAPPAPGAPPPAAPAADKPESNGDDAATRFGLLELD